MLAKSKLLIAGAVVLALAVMALCWQLWKPKPRVPEIYKPAVAQVDGSVILEKKPDAAAVPKQAIPAGAKAERLVSVTVRPRPMPAPSAGRQILGAAPVTSLSADAPFFNRSTACIPVTVDMSLVSMGDDWRVVASSADGEILGGVDIPVANVTPPPAPKLWAAGITVDPIRRLGGVFVDRDIAFARVGVQVNQRELGGFPDQIWVRAGIRW